MLDVTIKGVSKLQKDLKAEGKRQEKALSTTLKVEAFRLRGEMKKEIRKGAPGGRQFPPLTFLSRGLGIRTSKKMRMKRVQQDGAFVYTAATPLSRLANAIFYDSHPGKVFRATVGFGGKRTMPFMKRLAKIHQKGFERPVTPGLRKLIIHEGARRGKIEGGNTPFFVKKTTTRFKTPARPIIEPFIERHRTQALVNIRNNFRRKMAGERI